MVRSGLTAATLITDDPALFVVFASLPPLTLAVLVMEAGALEAMLACKVMAELEPAAKATARVQVTVEPIVQVQLVPVAEVTVNPVGIMSVTEMVPVVGPLPPLVTVNV